MVTIQINNMDLETIANSGQVFQWQKIEPCHYVIVSNHKTLDIKQNKEMFDFNCNSNNMQYWKHYFDLETDYSEVEDLIMKSNDNLLITAYQHSKGMRILNQNPWEVIVSFIISQNNNIPRIKKSIKAINDFYNSFPTSKQLSSASSLALESFGLGYRVEYIKKVSDYFSKHDISNETTNMNDFELITYLKSFKGIGDKVASCISLYGFGRKDVVPVDTHMKQIYKEYYPNGFNFNKYKGWNGLIQQYLFNYKLNYMKVKAA